MSHRTLATALAVCAAAASLTVPAPAARAVVVSPLAPRHGDAVPGCPPGADPASGDPLTTVFAGPAETGGAVAGLFTLGTDVDHFEVPEGVARPGVASAGLIRTSEVAVTAGPAPSPSASPSSPASPPAAAPGRAPNEGPGPAFTGPDAITWLASLGAAVVAGGAALLLLTRRRRRPERPER